MAQFYLIKYIYVFGLVLCAVIRIKDLRVYCSVSYKLTFE